ncbi:sce7726 family protein [Labilithrix luteola]|uniref:sce7726 family protein n=1 Tax=Labilithrix luteola TaxID=1391654 RepID=UPI0014761EEC|nr:sce7726 family protein [Labilithrix luteola]
MKDALAGVFELLQRSYRCDYVYRSTIAAKLFLGRHSPTTSALIPELRVWKSKADMAVFNGTSIAYEIKTELDNLDRLQSQLADYSAVFDRIFVVTYDGRGEELRATLPSHVGILVLTRTLSFQVVRDALSNAENVRPRMIVDALRRDEVIEVTRRVVGRAPCATEVTIRQECADALATCTPRSVHDAMVAVLKRRMRCTREQLARVPRPLLSAYLESGTKSQMWNRITERLTSVTLGDLIAHDEQILSIPQGEDV